MTEKIRDLQQVLEANPADRETFDTLADQYAETGDWRRLRWHFEKYSEFLDAQDHFEQLVFVLRELAAAEDDDQETAAILVALGDVLFEHLDEHDEGMEAYQKAFKTYRQDTTSLDRARRVYREAKKFKRVLLVYDLEKKVKKDPEELADVLVSIAQVHGDFLGDRQTAIDQLDTAVDQDPDHPMAGRIRDIYEAGGTVEATVEDRVREAHQAHRQQEDALAAEFMIDAARLERIREGGGLRKAAELAEQARQFQPNHLEAGDFLMEVYEQLEHHDELRELTESLQENADADDPTAPDGRVEPDGPGEDAPPDSTPDESLDEHSLAADGGQPDMAADPLADSADFEQARVRLADDPADRQALDIVRQQLRDEGAFEELADRLEQSLKYLRNQDGELEVMVELANVLAEELGNVERAEYYFKRVKLLDSEQPDMLAFYEDFFRREGQWRKLFALLNGKQPDGDGPQALELARELARIANVQMGSPEKAIDVWKKFLRDHPHHARAREQLRELYEEHAKWNALVDFLKDRVRSLQQEGDQTSSARVLLLERIVDIYRDELNIDVMVINTLNDILALEPGHSPAFDELRAKLVDSRRWNDLAGLLADRAELELDDDNPQRAVELLLDVADVWQQRVQNVTQALPYLERVADIQPDNESVRERLRQIYKQRGDYRSLFELEYAAANRQEGIEREQRLRELVALAQDRLRDPEGALRVLEELADLRPDDLELLGEIEAIHRRQNDDEQLADVLERQVTQGSDSAIYPALREAARLREDPLGDLEGAARLWESLLDDEPDDSEALAHLTDIYIAAERFADLRALYVDRGQVGKLCERLDEAMSAEDDPQRTSHLHRFGADLAADELDDHARSAAHLERLCDLVDDPREVAAELDEHYAEIEDFSGRLEAHRILVDHTDDDERSFELLVDMGCLAADHQEYERALEWLVEAAMLQPGQVDVLDRAEQAARHGEAVGVLAEHLDLIADSTDDDAARAAIWSRLGRILRDDQHDESRAVQYFERLRERDPEDLDVLAALEELYHRLDRPRARIEVLREQIDLLSAAGAERSDLVDQLANVADVQRTHLDQVEAARDTYNEILDLDPNHVGALRGIRELYRAEQQWDAVVESLHRELSVLPTDAVDAQTDAQMELADTLRLEAGDLHDAIHAYGRVLGQNPEHQGAVAAVEELLAEPQMARQAALMLEPIFRETQCPDQLAGALEARRAVAQDRFEEAEILDELIELYEDVLDDAPLAFELARRQFELDPERREIWSRVERLGAELDRWEDIEAAFAAQAPSGDALEAGRVDLLRHLASIREHRLHRQADALDIWEQIHQVQPTDSSAIEALERLHRALGHHQQLVDILEKREQLLDNDARRIDVLEEIAQLSDALLEDPSRTIDAFQRIVALEADHREAVEGLIRLYQSRQQWDELDELYASQADLAVDPERRRRFLLALGTLRADQLADYAGAHDLLSQLVAEDPGDEAAVEAVEALDATLANLGNRPELRVDIARALEPVYRSRRDLQKLADILEVRAEQTDQLFEKVALFDELIELYLAEMDDDQAGFDALARGVVVDPEEPGRRMRLVETARRIDRLDEAADALEEAAQSADPPASASLYRQLGGMYEDNLQQPRQAIAAFEQARRQDESDRDTLAALERLYQRTNQHEQLAEILGQQVIFGDLARRPARLERAGTLYEDVLDRPTDAIDAYVELLDEQPDSTAGFDGLERLYSAQERWIDLADTLRRRCEASGDDQARIAALTRLADVYRDQLDDLHEAVSVHRRILGVDPQYGPSLDALEELFEADQQWHELADVLDDKLASVHAQPDDSPHRAAIELKLADVLKTHLFDIDRALDLYRSVRRQRPDDPAVIAAFEDLLDDETYAAQVTDDLVEHYRRNEQFDRLIEVWETRKSQSYEPADKVACLQKIAHIYRDDLDEPKAAIDALADAWELEPHREDLHHAVLELAAPSQAWQRLGQVYEDVLDQASEPDVLLDLHLSLANLYRDHLDDPLRAEASLRDGLTIDPQNQQAYRSLESILTDRERWIDLVELLEDKVNASAHRDDAQTADLLVRIAGLQVDHLDDEFSAAETYRRVLDFEPSHLEANKSLSRLYRQQARWEDLAGHLNGRIDRADEPQQAIDFKHRLADLQRTELGNPAAAVELYRDILTVEPGHSPSVDALEALFDQEAAVRADIARMLEPVYRRQGRHQALVDVLSARAEGAQSADQARNYLQEAAQIADDDLDDRGQAVDILSQLFVQEPFERNVRVQLHHLNAVVDRWDQLADLYADVLQNNYEVDDELRVELLVEQAAVYETRLNRLDDARSAYAEALRDDVHNQRAVDGIERILSRNQNWLDLAEFYLQRADAAVDPDRAKGWLERLATLYEEVIDNLDEAVEVYARMNELDPDDGSTQDTLVRLYGHAHRWHELADLYRRRIDQTYDPDQAMELRFQLAGLLESELDLVDDALQIYRDILAGAPGHQETLRALDGLRRDLASRDGDFVAYRQQIIDLLLEHYNEQKHWRRIAELLEEKQDLVGDVGGQVDALAEMADIIQRGAEDEADKMRALLKLARAYCIDPHNDTLRERVHQRANQLDGWERVIPIFLQGLQVSDDPEVQAALLTAVAEAYTGPLDDTESAITAYQQAVEINGEPDALARLQHLYGELELWEPLVHILERRLDDEFDVDARHDLLSRIAMIYGDILDRPDDAVVAYRELHDQDPAQLSVLDALARLYKRTDRHEDLAETLANKLQLLDESARDERIATLSDLAEVQDQQLDAAADAIVSYNRLMELTDADRDTLATLSRLYQSTHRWAELLDNLAAEREFVDDVDQLNAISLRMAVVVMDKLEAPGEAVEPLAAIVERDPEHMDARQALVDLLQQPASRRPAGDILEQTYRGLDDWEALKELYEHQLDHLDDSGRRAEVYMELAQLQEERFDNRQMAFVTLGRAFRELPTVTFLHHELERVSRSLGNIDELAAIYEDTLESATLDRDAKLALQKRLGTLYADSLDNPQQAIGHFEQAHRLDEYDRDVLEWLDRLYQQADRWRDLVDILDATLAVADTDQLNDVRFRLAYLHEVMFDNHRDALDLYRQIVADEPQHGGAIEGLERMSDDLDVRGEICELLAPIYRQADDDQALAELYEHQLEVADTSAERANLHRQIADIHLDKIGNIYVGYAHLGRALRQDPHDVGIQQRLESLADNHDLHDQLVALYEEVVDDLDDPVRVVELAENAARWAFSALDEPERASHLYRRVLDIEPDHQHALDSLETIARREDQPIALEAALSRKAEASFDPDVRKSVLLELGEVRMRLEQFEAAINAYRQALTLDESDMEVLHQLVALFEITERYEDLVDTLERLAAHIENDGERRMLYVRIGQYTRHFIDAPERSIEAYRRADELESGDLDVLEALEQLYRRTDQWHNLVEVIGRELDTLDDTDPNTSQERLRLLVERASVHYDRFDQTREAIDDYQRAFAIQKDSELVVEALDELYRGEQRWDDLMELYRQQLQLASDDDRLVELHIDMADICHGHLDDDDRAIELINTVLELRPRNCRALKVSQSIHERNDQWESVAEVLARRADAVDDDDVVEVLLERADVFETRLARPEAAAEVYINVLEVDPGHKSTLNRLKELYERMEAFEQLYAIRDHEAELAATDDARVAIYREMAELADHRLDEPSLRSEALQKAYRLRDDDLTIVEPLLDAYIENESFDRAEPILGDIIATLRDERNMKDVVRFEHLKGKLLEQKGELAHARAAYEAAHKVDATYIPNLFSLGKLLVRTEQWQAALKIFQTLLLHQMNIDDDAHKVDLFYNLGRVRLQTGNQRQARNMFTRALGIDADHQPSQQALADL